MTDPRVDEWVAKAEEDYVAARTLDANATPGPVCFHCQQRIGNRLKAALAANGLPVRRTHDLVILNAFVAEHDARFEPLTDQVSILSAYSVVSRYPGMSMTPHDAQEALATASVLRSQMRTLLGLPRGT